MPTALIIAEYGTLNGGENSLLAVLPELKKRGWQLMAAVPGGTAFAESLANCGVPNHSFAFSCDGNRLPLSELRSRFQILIDRLSPNIVHCNSLATARICGPVCRDRKQPSIGYLRDIINLSRQAIRDLNAHSQLIAVSLATRNHHVAQGLDCQRVRVIYNGVDDQVFHPGPGCNDIRNELGLPADCRLVLFVGQIGLRKGLDVWLDAAKLILESENNTHFLIAGQRHSQKRESIEYGEMLLARSESSPWRGHVHWLGTRTDVPDLMRQSSLLMHCAHQEPLGRVLLESSASGLPIVATDVGGTAEIMRHPALKDLLVEKGSPEMASRAAIALLRDNDYCHQIAAIVQETARQQFSVARCARKMLEVYEEVVQTGGARQDPHLGF